MLVVILGLYELYEWRSKGDTPLLGAVERLTAPRLAPDAYGRAGDLVLRSPGDASLTVVSAPDIPGHRPLLGAVVDIAVERGDTTDPLIWLKTTTLNPAGELAEPAWRSPQPFTCSEGGAGARAYGPIGTGLTQEICVVNAGLFRFSTSIGSAAKAAVLVDELNVGTLPVVVGRGVLIDGDADTDFVAFGDKGMGALVEAPHMHASRTASRFGEEVFPAPVVLRYGEGTSALRYFHVVRGDALAAVATLSSANRVFDVTFGPNRGGDVSLRDAGDVEIARGEVAAGATRTFRLPPALGDHLALRDDRGVLTDARVPLPGSGGHAAIVASAASPGTLTLEYHDASGAPLPVHVLFKGQNGTPDPRPAVADGRTVRAGRSLYLLDGRTKLPLPAGAYRITASHGMAYTLAVSDVTLTEGGDASVSGELHPAIDTSAWVSGDFHLHSAPSPDSDVSLEERVESLVAEGVDLAVATDHNRITDYSASVRALGQERRLGTARGVELTAAGQRWGHFNAYPMPVPTVSPEEATPIYFGKRPAEMFDSARRLGARVLQVNHARMDPGIGYFDLAHLDSNTGRASGEFSADFDVFEAYNGMWIERREKVREGPRDLVALARRGKRVAAVGDSDSHKLLYEEAGYPRTYVHTPSEPVETRFDRAVGVLLGSRDTTVTSGPFVEMTVDGNPVGSVMQPSSGSVHVKVRVSAPAWVPVDRVEVWRDDTVARTFTVEGPPRDGLRFEGETDVPLDGADRTVLAWAEADTPLPDVVPYDHALSIGFTGLVYVDVDRDGTVVVPAATPAP
ncbi:MAG TPA: CehA/McbA family metallohydrolase [Polyangiaceae bacterium]|nr:CehA/McbA family metallohydrolase [Polyangiaceae bacterium]